LKGRTGIFLNFGDAQRTLGGAGRNTPQCI